MKVAVIGAGIAGLSCAYELKRRGIVPTVFEKKSFTGDAFDLNIVTMKMFHRPVNDPVKYFKDKYNLELKPISRLSELKIIGPTKMMTVKNNLGYIFKRGWEHDSLSNQLLHNTGITVELNSYIQDVGEIKDYFDYIVVATGDDSIVKRMNAWKTAFHSYIRIATIIGQFRTGVLTAWFNTKYSKHTFAFMVANSPKEAVLTLIVDGITLMDLDYYWKEFLFKEDINYTITETRDIEYNTGFANPLQLGNVYFIGNSGGFTDGFLGFGMVNSIHSGVLAARSIAAGEDYSKLVSPILKEINVLYELRKVLNSSDNKDFDAIVGLLGNSISKKLSYSNPFFSVGQPAFITKLYNIVRKK